MDRVLEQKLILCSCLGVGPVPLTLVNCSGGREAKKVENFEAMFALLYRTTRHLYS